MSGRALFGAIALIALLTLPAQAQDVDPPVFTGVPANFNVEATSAAGAIVNYVPPTADDAIEGPVPVTSDPLPGTQLPLGNTLITFTAQDSVPNIAIATTTVTVEDTTAPSITAPGAQNINTDPGLATGTLLDYTSLAIVTDAVDTAPVVTQSTVAGTALPIGPNTVTHTATDASGNFDSADFTVTVIDNQAPAFGIPFPADASISVGYPITSAVHTWTEPTATDNSGVPQTIARTTSPTAGLASGSAFPLGTTTVTYRATDGAGNFTEQSFTVTVTQIPPGEVTFIIESGADGSFPFTSAEPDLNFAINVVAGTGTSGAILIAPGSYDFAFSVPAGSGLTGATCTDTDSSVDIAAKTGTAVLATSESVTCTISSVDAVGETTAQIGAFVEDRARLIIQNGPAPSRRLERLKGSYTNDGGVSGLGLGYASGNVPMSVRLSTNQASFSYSLRKSQAEAADSGVVVADDNSSRGEDYDKGLGIDRAGQSSSMLMGFAQSNIMSKSSGPLEGHLLALVDEKTGRTGANPMQYRTDIWAEGTLAGIDGAGGSGTFAILHGGFDYLVTRRLLIGLGIQGDWMEQGAVSGSGYLVGPYATARISNGLYFDARGAWGQSFNEISPFGTYTDEFDAERWLASAAIIGDYDVGSWNIRPEARVDYFEENTEAYIDSLSVLIPSVEVSVGELTLGPTFTYTLPPADGGVTSMFFGIDGIWTFDSENTATTAAPGAIGLADTGLRARVEAGLSADFDDGFSFSTSAFYDGIGNDDFSAWGGKVRVSKRFQ